MTTNPTQTAEVHIDIPGTFTAVADVTDTGITITRFTFTPLYGGTPGYPGLRAEVTDAYDGGGIDLDITDLDVDLVHDIEEEDDGLFVQALRHALAGDPVEGHRSPTLVPIEWTE